MADLTITAANCVIGTNAVIPSVTQTSPLAGVAITAGMSVYLSAANIWLKALCSGTAIQSGVGTRFGVALHAAGIGQPVAVQESGQITIGATVAVGTKYVISTNAGMIAPASDLTTSNLVTELGIAISTTVIDMTLKNATGIVHA